MEVFFRGKTNKIVMIILITVVPMIILGAVFNDAYFISSMISSIMIIAFINRCQSSSIYNQGNIIKNSQIVDVFIVAIFPVLFQMMLFSFSASKGDSISELKTTSVFNLINILLFAPAMEEIAFRWSIPELFFIKQFSVKKYIALSLIMSMIFTLFHGFPHINLTIMIFSLMLYFVYYKTRNCLYCAVFHISYNSSCFIITQFTKLENINFIHNGIVIVIEFLIGVMLAVWFYKRNDINDKLTNV